MPISTLSRSNINGVRSTYGGNFDSSSIGIVVDYLFRYIAGATKEQAFRICLNGAALVGERPRAEEILNEVSGINKGSIIAAFRLRYYDGCYRCGAKGGKDVYEIVPSYETIRRTTVLLQRCVKFNAQYGPIKYFGPTFEGGYNNIISTGDADFMSDDTLWDLKTSEYEPDSQDLLQILVYYILGVHSVHEEFQGIKAIGIVNAARGEVYRIKVKDIPDIRMYNVCKNVIGYNMPVHYADWRLSSGTNADIVNLEMARMKPFVPTSFNPSNFEDGIYDISVDDLWTYWRDKTTSHHKPLYYRVDKVKLLKNGGCIMFIAEKKNGKLAIIAGGMLRNINHSIEYYYTWLPTYCLRVKEVFGQYWKILFQLSDEIKRLYVDKAFIRTEYYDKYVKHSEENKLQPEDFETYYGMQKWLYEPSGLVHGCIVDIGFFSHLFINPFDGVMASYYATSKQDKYLYKSPAQLIAMTERPLYKSLTEMMSANQSCLLSRTNESLLPQYDNGSGSVPLLVKEEVENEGDKYPADESEYDAQYNEDMEQYAISYRIKMLQYIHDYNAVAAWYDSFLTLHSIGETKS